MLRLMTSKSYNAQISTQPVHKDFGDTFMYHSPGESSLGYLKVPVLHVGQADAFWIIL